MAKLRSEFPQTPLNLTLREEQISTILYCLEGYVQGNDDEELVAEIGSSVLCSEAGLNSEVVFNNTLAYCQSWAKKLKSDPQWILWASSRALTASNYILGEKNDK